MLRAKAKKAIILSNPLCPSTDIEIIEGHTYAISYKSDDSHIVESNIVGRVSKIVESAYERRTFNGSAENGQLFSIFVDISTEMYSNIVEIKTYNILSATPVLDDATAMYISENISTLFNKAEVYRTENGNLKNEITLIGEGFGSVHVKVNIEVSEIK